ncbi:MAG: Flp family type IVb pilin [Caldilinea sp. CFX5]|nr:Flp family type IVb pilin [Caldilinea sp. CFX5]
MSIHYLTAKVTNYLTDQRGQGLVEYALLISLITIALISSLLALRDEIDQILSSIPFPE